jgi:hypothetical protein
MFMPRFLKNQAMAFMASRESSGGRVFDHWTRVEEEAGSAPEKIGKGKKNCRRRFTRADERL